MLLRVEFQFCKSHLVGQNRECPVVKFFALLIPISHRNAQLKDTDPERVKPRLFLHHKIFFFERFLLLLEYFCRLQIGFKFLSEVVPCDRLVSILARASRARRLILHQLVEGFFSLTLVIRLFKRYLLLCLIFDLIEHLMHILDDVDRYGIILREAAAQAEFTNLIHELLLLGSDLESYSFFVVQSLQLLLQLFSFVPERIDDGQPLVGRILKTLL